MTLINKTREIEHITKNSIYLSTMVFNNDISKAIELSEKFNFRFGIFLWQSGVTIGVILLPRTPLTTRGTRGPSWFEITR